MFRPDKGAYPRLTISNITLGKDKISIKAFLTETQKFFKSYRRDDNKILSSSNIYFILSVPKDLASKETLPAGILANPEKRIQNIAYSFKMKPYQVSQWYKHLSRDWHCNFISLEQVISSKGDITVSEATNSTSFKDANFEVSIPIDPKLYESVDISEVSVHVFAHYDTAASLQDVNSSAISQHVRVFYKMGGNLKSKKILERVGDKLKPVMTKTIKIDSQGKAYNGKTRMANGVMETVEAQGVPSRPITTVQAPENAISPEYFIEKIAQPSPEKSSELTLDKIEYSYTKPINNIRTINSRDSDENIFSTGYAGFIKTLRTKQALASKPSGFLTNSYHYLSSTEAANVVYFEMNLDKIIKQKTEYGYLLDIAEKYLFAKDILSAGNLTSTSMDPKDIIQKANITEVMIKRTRVYESERVSTPIGSAKKSIDNSLQETILHTSDFNFTQGTYQQPNISLSVNKNKSTYKKKCISIYDYELYSLASKGEYVYTVEMVLETKFSEYFETILAKFKKLLNDCEIYLEQVQRDKKNVLSVKEKLKDPLSMTAGYGYPVYDLARIYILTMLLMGKEIQPNEVRETLDNILRTAGLTSGGTISGAHKFHEMCNTLMHDFVKFIKSFGKSFPSGMKDTMKNASNPSAKEVPHQRLSLVVPGVSKTVDTGEVLLSYAGISGDVLVSDVVSQNGLPIKPSSYQIKTSNGANRLMNEAELVNETNKRTANRKAAILDNVIKSNTPTFSVADKLKIVDTPLEIETVFGLPGVTISLPTIEGTFASNSESLTSSPTAADNLQSGLSSVLESSLASSIKQKTNINKMDEQTTLKTKKSKISEKRNFILDKVIGLLGVIEQRQPLPKYKRQKVEKPDLNRSAEDKLFKHRAGPLKMCVYGTSGEMEFVPITMEQLNQTADDNIVVKIEAPDNKRDNEEYTVVNNIFEVAKTSLKNLLS